MKLLKQLLHREEIFKNKNSERISDPKITFCSSQTNPLSPLPLEWTSKEPVNRDTTYGRLLAVYLWWARLIEELRDRREGKGRLRFFGYLMQLEGEGGVIVRQSFKKRLMEI